MLKFHCLADANSDATMMRPPPAISSAFNAASWSPNTAKTVLLQGHFQSVCEQHDEDKRRVLYRFLACQRTSPERSRAEQNLGPGRWNLGLTLQNAVGQGVRCNYGDTCRSNRVASTHSCSSKRCTFRRRHICALQTLLCRRAAAAPEAAMRPSTAHAVPLCQPSHRAVKEWPPETAARPTKTAHPATYGS